MLRDKPVAIKCLADYSTENSFDPIPRGKDLEHEATILSLLGHHPNIVDFHGLCRESDNVYVVTKLEEGGCIKDRLGLADDFDNFRRQGIRTGNIEGSSLDRWARDLARGLVHSHSAGVVHNDVATRNVLLSMKGNGGSALLCDFGISSRLRGQKVEAASLIDFSSNGRKLWPVRQMPKEALEPLGMLSHFSDSWMYALTLYEVRFRSLSSTALRCVVFCCVVVGCVVLLCVVQTELFVVTGFLFLSAGATSHFKKIYIFRVPSGHEYDL